MNAHDPRLAELARIAAELDVLCDNDEALFADMMEGETDVHTYVQRLHDSRAEDQERIVGLKARMDELTARKHRYEAREAATKAAIGKVLRVALLPKIELPEATYSVRDGKPALRVVDPEAVPEPFQRVKAEPDKAAINEHFADAAELPNWLVREPARDVVTARTK
jgi:hypothetical protein